MSNNEAEKIKSLNETVHSKDKKERDQAYNDYVKQVTPTHNLIFNMVKAFFTGGIICCIGQSSSRRKDRFLVSDVKSLRSQVL